MENTHLVFVYGTLKSGGHNNHIMTRGRGESVFVGRARTADRVLLRDGGFPRMSPVDLDNDSEVAHCGHVFGEVWRLNEAAFKAVDRLEGHPTFYTRAKIIVDLRDSPGFLVAWAYFILNPSPEATYMTPALGGFLEWNQTTHFSYTVEPDDDE